MSYIEATQSIKNNSHRVNIVDLLLSAFVLIWWLEIGLRIVIFGKIRLEFIVGFLLSIIAVLKIAKSEQSFIGNPLIKAIIFFHIVIIVSLPLSVSIERSFEIYLDHIFKLTMISIFMSVLINTTFQLKLFLITSFVAFFKIGMESFLGKITGSMVWENQGVMRLHGTQGSMFGHPNSLSGKFLGIFPFIWYIFPLTNKKWKMLLLIMSLFIGNILIFTASRTGYISFLFALAYIFYHSNKRLKLFSILITCLAITFCFIPDQYSDRFMSSFTGIEKEGASSETRKGLFYDSIDVFLDNPFGVGIGGFIVVQKMYGRNAQDTHNLYTQILTETGVQGFAAFGILIFLIFRQISLNIRALDRMKNERDFYVKEKEKSNTNLEVDKFFLDDINFLSAVCKASQLFLGIRLILGFFGHDLYEIYWWIIAGSVISVENCIKNSKVFGQKIELNNLFVR